MDGTAAAARRYLIGLGPLFSTPPHPVFIGPGGLVGCALVGLAAGVLSALLTLAVYAGSTCSGTAVTSGTGTTGANGTAGFTFSTRQTGSWCALATASATGYSAGTSNTATFSTP